MWFPIFEPLKYEKCKLLFIYDIETNQIKLELTCDRCWIKKNGENRQKKSTLRNRWLNRFYEIIAILFVYVCVNENERKN